MVQRQLHPGVKWAFRIRGFFSLLFFFLFFGIWAGIGLTSFLLSFSGFDGGNIVLGVVFGALILFFIFLILIEVYARLSYKFWKYEFTEDQLRIERGIIWKRYSNIPYQRIQNVDITRGIIARILGFSSVNIQTAGYSMPVNARGMGMMSEGYIPAVGMEEAEQIREFVMKKISKRHGQGL